MSDANRPRTVIAYVNIAHLIDHYAMLVFAAAVIIMAPAFGADYGDLLPYATPGFIAFGAGALAMGWLGDRWSRRHMMVIFFLGLGLSLVAVGLAQTRLQLGAALFAVGLFAAIYHPVGTAMLVSYADRLGREIGINGLWGNIGVAISALATGILCQYFGWRWAFAVPGAASIIIGIMFAAAVKHESRTSQRANGAAARVAKDQMWRVVVALLVTIIAISTTFNAITIALPKLFAERLSDLAANPSLLGIAAAAVYLFGAVAQYTIGKLIDRYPLNRVFLPISLVLTPLLYIAAETGGWPILLVSIGIVIGLFGQITINDAMVGKYTSDEWRGRAYAVRYFVGFTAAGASVSLVAGLHAMGGFALTLKAFAGLCVLVVIGALAFPREEHQGAAAEQDHLQRA